MHKANVADGFCLGQDDGIQMPARLRNHIDDVVVTPLGCYVIDAQADGV